MGQKWSTALFQYILIALNLTKNKNKLYKTSFMFEEESEVPISNQVLPLV